MRYLALLLLGVSLSPLTASDSEAGNRQRSRRQAIDYNLEDAKLCMMHIPRNERKLGIPLYLLEAIATNESGRVVPGRDSAVPWPWAVNTGGRGYLFSDRQKAIDFVYGVLEKGNPYVDVGCMQINIRYHHQAFRTVEDALDPAQNVAYGAKFLRQNYDRTRSWKTAAMHYHSQSPGRGGAYVSGIISRWKRLIASDGNRDMLDGMPLMAEAQPQPYRAHPWQLSAPAYLMPQLNQYGSIQPAVAQEANAASLQLAAQKRPGKWQRVMQRNVQDIMVAEPVVEAVAADAPPAEEALLPTSAVVPAAAQAPAPATQPTPDASATPSSPSAEAAPAQPSTSVPASAMGVAAQAVTQHASALPAPTPQQEALLAKIDQQTQVIELTPAQIEQARQGQVNLQPGYAAAVPNVLIDGQKPEANGKSGQVAHFPVAAKRLSALEQQQAEAKKSSVHMVFPQ